jgi:hypothetical protein
VADEWEPFGLDEEEQISFQVLVPGVPKWMRSSFRSWMLKELPGSGAYAYTSVIRTIENECRVTLPVSTTEQFVSRTTVANILDKLPETHLLRIADWLLARYGDGVDPRELDEILKNGRSKWMVGRRLGKKGLVERVPDGVQQAVEGVIASTGNAGMLLARAWADIHGIEPKPSSAYAMAIRAVEAAAIPVVQPKKSDATLGTVLGQMKADGDWRLPLREHADAPGPQMLLSMLRTLWFGHRDRHGSADYADVTQEEARAAVMLAATLVEWLTSGAVARRSK